MPVNVVYYRGFAQDQTGGPVPVVDDRSRINVVTEQVAVGGQTEPAPEGTIVAIIQGTEEFRFRVGDLPDLNDLVYAIGERVVVRLGPGDTISFGA